MADITSVTDQILWEWFYHLNSMLSLGIEAGAVSNVIIAEMRRRGIEQRNGIWYIDNDCIQS